MSIHLRCRLCFLLSFGCLDAVAGTAAPPTLTAFSGEATLFTRGVYLGGGGGLLTFRHSAEANLVFAADGKWREIYFSEPAPGVSSSFTAIDDEAWLVRHGGTVWVSPNKGLSWIEVAAAPGPVLKSDPAALAELGRLGALKWDSRSARLSWEGPADLMVDDFTSVSAISNLVAVAAVRFNGKYGTETFGLVKTQDGGRHWDWLVKKGDFAFDGSGNYHAHHVFFLTEMSGWISSDYLDNMYHTADGGKTWVEIKAPDRVVSSTFFRNEQEGWIIGGSTARIYATSNGGASWRELSNVEILAPSFFDNFRGAPENRWNDFGVYRLVLAKTPR